MQLLVFDMTTLLPAKLIENYTSLIWTERWQANGEFELKTGDIQNTMANMPLDALITHLETNVVMVIETYVIAESEQDGSQELTITGRTFETWLDNRPSLVAQPLTPNVIPSTTPVAAVQTMIQVSMLVGTVIDVYWGISWVQLINLTTIAGPTPVDMAIEWTGMYEAIMKIIVGSNFDISAERVLGTAGVALILRNNANRTATNGAIKPVVFRAAQGDISNLQYVISKRNYKTVGGYIMGGGYPNSYGIYYNQAITQNPPVLTGYQTKTLAEDYTDITSGLGNTANARIDPVLSASARTSIISGKIENTQAGILGTDYFVGDKVTINGDYGITQDVLITEYVRTEDLSGDQAYLSFVQSTS